MKTVNLQKYADPDALREFSPRMLVALMDEHRPFLASKGVELPPVETLQTATGDGEFNYEVVAPIFRAVEDIPKDLVERFHMVRQMTGFRTLRTAKTESVSTESKASQVSPAADSDGVYLQSEYFRTLRTPLSNPRAYAKENMYMCKDTESGVLPVLTTKPLPFLTPGGDLSIPFDSPERYHWWKLDGNRQSVAETLNEVRERMNCADDF